MFSLRLHSPYTSRPCGPFLCMSLRAALLRDSYRTARSLGMTARAAFGLARLANDCGL